MGNFIDRRRHNEDVQCRILYFIKLFCKKIFQGLARKSYNFSLPLFGGFQIEFQILTARRKASRKKILILIISYTQFTPSPVYLHCKHLEIILIYRKESIIFPGPFLFILCGRCFNGKGQLDHHTRTISQIKTHKNIKGRLCASIILKILAGQEYEK